MKIFFIICLILIIILLIVNIADINRFIQVDYKIGTDKIDKEIKVVFLSDMHNKEFGKENRRLFAAIRNINPDIICCGGDMLTAHPGVDTMPPVRLLSKLKDYPIYYGIGNHEYRMKIYRDDYGNTYDEYVEKLKGMGVKVLENERAVIEALNISIQGLMIDKSYYKRFEKKEMTSEYVRELTGHKGKEYEIMLAHNPEYFKAYEESGADLVLSGHIHGGIVRLPFVGGVISPRLRLFPKFDGGLFVKNNTTMVLSRGIGSHTLPIRIFNPGELIVITLLPCKN